MKFNVDFDSRSSRLEREQAKRREEAKKRLEAEQKIKDRLVKQEEEQRNLNCLLYTSPSPRDRTRSRMPSSA